MLAWEACEGPNTPDQARRLMAETAYHLEDTWYSGHGWQLIQLSYRSGKNMV